MSLTARDIWGVLKSALAGWWNDNVPRMGAALAYYTLFSLAPVLVVAIAIAGLAFGPEAVRGEIVGQIKGLIGVEGATAVQAMLEGAAKPSSSIPATILGIITFFIGATGAFLELQTDLDAIWRVKPKEDQSFFKALVKQRLISFALVLGNMFPGVAVLWEAVNVVVSLAVISALFAMIYKVLPDVKLAWSDVVVGALVTAGLFTIGKSVIGLYIGASALSSTYGAAGSVIVILVWVYYSAQIILLGAEFTREYVERFGRKPRPEVWAKKGTKALDPT
jgi:membrane protein